MNFALNVSVLLVSTFITYVIGHGMMMDPVGRNSRWRLDKTAPINYNDNELFCGGLSTMWNTNNGKCGLCGDNWSAATPRAHEIGGQIGGSGVIVAKYQSGGRLPVSVNLSANHKGYFAFDLCNLDLQNESEECFAKIPIRTEAGDDKYYLPSYDNGMFNFHVLIPEYVKCQHCVLRWTYTGANNWGQCGNGTGVAGCGPQEVFKNCADISIY